MYAVPANDRGYLKKMIRDSTAETAQISTDLSQDAEQHQTVWWMAAVISRTVAFHQSADESIKKRKMAMGMIKKTVVVSGMPLRRCMQCSLEPNMPNAK